jgi:hypothetical protein
MASNPEPAQPIYASAENRHLENELQSITDSMSRKQGFACQKRTCRRIIPPDNSLKGGTLPSYLRFMHPTIALSSGMLEATHKTRTWPTTQYLQVASQRPESNPR